MTAAEQGPPLTVVVDGVALQIRALRPEDATGLQAMHQGLSERTVYQRFLGALPDLSRAQAHYFCDVDGDRRVALVAVSADGTCVAVGRYDRLPPSHEQAEIAVVVADRFQHHGLGTTLVTLLRHQAASAGVRSFVADILSTNTAMRGAFTDAGLVPHWSWDHGVSHLVMPLSDPVAELGTFDPVGRAPALPA